VSNDLVITRQEEKGQWKRQEPLDFELLSAAANSAITQFSPVLKVTFYSLHYGRVMLEFRVKTFVLHKNRAAVFNACLCLPKNQETSRGLASQSEFSPRFLNNLSRTKKKKFLSPSFTNQ